MVVVPGPVVPAVVGQRGVWVKGMKTYMSFIKDGCDSWLNHRPDWLASVQGPEES